MPWKNVTPMEEIIRFASLAQSDRFTLTELCEQFGISRKTGYKHLERYAAAGIRLIGAGFGVWGDDVECH
jgi:response regulator of citrate/malate metabolism